MDMYSQLLAVAAREWVDTALGLELVEHARRCRSELAASEATRDDPSEVLAAAIRYDGSLLRLSASVGIETSSHRFSPPIAERRRLELELTSRGIDLTVPSPPLRRVATAKGVVAG